MYGLKVKDVSSFHGDGDDGFPLNNNNNNKKRSYEL